jgi:predicted DNA-binding protein (UPF0278 family)
MARTKKRDTVNIRVKDPTRHSLKVASARLDVPIWTVLARVEQGDRKALAVWQAAAREVGA